MPPLHRYPLGQKVSPKWLYLERFSRYKRAIFAKNSKIENSRHFWQDKFFGKLGWLLHNDSLLMLKRLAKFASRVVACINRRLPVSDI